MWFAIQILLLLLTLHFSSTGSCWHRSLCCCWLLSLLQWDSLLLAPHVLSLVIPVFLSVSYFTVVSSCLGVRCYTLGHQFVTEVAIAELVLIMTTLTDPRFWRTSLTSDWHFPSLLQHTQTQWTTQDKTIKLRPSGPLNRQIITWNMNSQSRYRTLVHRAKRLSATTPGWVMACTTTHNEMRKVPKNKFLLNYLNIHCHLFYTHNNTTNIHFNLLH